MNDFDFFKEIGDTISALGLNIEDPHNASASKDTEQQLPLAVVAPKVELPLKSISHAEIPKSVDTILNPSDILTSLLCQTSQSGKCVFCKSPSCQSGDAHAVLASAATSSAAKPPRRCREDCAGVLIPFCDKLTTPNLPVEICSEKEFCARLLGTSGEVFFIRSEVFPLVIRTMVLYFATEEYQVVHRDLQILDKCVNTSKTSDVALAFTKTEREIIISHILRYYRKLWQEFQGEYNDAKNENPPHIVEPLLRARNSAKEAFNKNRELLEHFFATLTPSETQQSLSLVEVPKPVLARRKLNVRLIFTSLLSQLLWWTGGIMNRSRLTPMGFLCVSCGDDCRSKDRENEPSVETVENLPRCGKDCSSFLINICHNPNLISAVFILKLIACYDLMGCPNLVGEYHKAVPIRRELYGLILKVLILYLASEEYNSEQRDLRVLLAFYEKGLVKRKLAMKELAELESAEPESVEEKPPAFTETECEIIIAHIQRYSPKDTQEAGRDRLLAIFKSLNH
uniref:Uncharacterized protein n=1 Tax=viral metagenome TaxID=1070528 RepID=A0A6C0DXY0_9ZZZZ